MKDIITAWMDNAGRYKVLSKQETIEVAEKIQAAAPGSAEHTKWVNKLCRHNLKYVIGVVRSYMNGGARKLYYGDDKTADMLQQGYLGLRRAAEKFDPDRGYTFTTYANAWIRQSIGKYHIDTMSTIRVPESSAREIFTYLKNGTLRNPQGQKWVPAAAVHMRNAYNTGSLDAIVAEEIQIMDLITDEQSLTYREQVEPTPDRTDYYGIMGACGIEPRIQDLLLEYARRGNLQTVLMRHKCDNKQTRLKVREAERRVKAFVASQAST
jgi:RNA polymerase sigma factor (sigma-70 family)